METAPPGAAGSSSFVPYLNFNQRIRISYPAGWNKQEQNASRGFAVVFLSPQEDFSDHFADNLGIFIEPIPDGMTLEQYTQGCLAGMAQLPLQFSEQGPSSVGGRPAYRFVYTGPSPGPVPMSLKYLQFLVVANSHGYVVTYTAEMAKYDKFLPVIEQMLHSLEIK